MDNHIRYHRPDSQQLDVVVDEGHHELNMLEAWIKGGINHMQDQLVKHGIDEDELDDNWKAVVKEMLEESTYNLRRRIRSRIGNAGGVA